MMREYFEKIYKDGMECYIKDLEYRLANSVKTFIVTANPETLMIGTENKMFDEILKDPNITIVPDGIGVVKAAQSLGIDVQDRVTGVEISKHLLESANRLKKSIYFFGAKEDIVNTLVKKVQNEYPNLVIKGYSNGYVKDKDRVFNQIVERKPDIVLVALGIPQQELLIKKHYSKFDKGIFVGVGGSFDVLSGMKKRAPAIFIKYNLEWLYRIVKEPKRLKRFYKSNIKFINIIRKMR